MAGKHWSRKEISILKKRYPISTIEELVILLPNRSNNAIVKQANRMGLKKTKETYSKIYSKAHKGRKAWNKGLRLSLIKEWKEKQLANTPRGKRHPLYGKKRPDFASRYGHKEEFERKRLRACVKRPNKKERLLLNILRENNLPFEYVGNGAKLIQYGKHILNPDFMDTINQRKIIELFGDYWHKRKDIEWIRTPEGRKKILRELGYGVLIIWEHQLENPNEIVTTVKKFYSQL